CITGTAEPDHSPGSNDRNYHPYAEFYAFLYYVFHFVSLGDALEQCDPYGRLLNARPCVCDHGFDTIPGYVLYNRIIIHPGAVTEHKSVALRCPQDISDMLHICTGYNDPPVLQIDRIGFYEKLCHLKTIATHSPISSAFISS